MTQCIFLLAFTALKNDCSFLWPPEPEPEEVTFKESLFTPSSGRGPLRELCEAAPCLGADPRACIQTRQFGKNSRREGAGAGKGAPPRLGSGEGGQGHFPVGTHARLCSGTSCKAGLW